MATVYDNEITDDLNREKINGDYFAVAIEDVDQLDEDKVIALAKAKAINIDTHATVKLNADFTNIKSEKGVYEVKFFTEAGTTLSVYASVYDSEITDELKREKVNANDFAVEINEVEQLNEDKVIALAKAQAINIDTHTPIKLNVDFANIKSEKGVYQVKFFTDAGTSLIVNARVFDQGIEDDLNKEKINADNFSVAIEDVDQLDEDKVIALAKAQAINIDTHATVKLNADFINIKSEKGVYEVKFFTDAGTSLIVYASVYDHEVTDDLNKEKIIANDFAVAINDVNKLDEARVIELAKAQAIKIETHSSVRVRADYSDIRNIKGNYKVRFFTDSGTSISVNVNVYDEGITNESNRENIFANNFAVSIHEVNSLNSEKVIALSKAQARNIDTHAALQLHVDFKSIKKEVGIYKVSFTTDKGTSVKVNATVFNDDIINQSYQGPIYKNGNSSYSSSSISSSSTSSDKVEQKKVKKSVAKKSGYAKTAEQNSMNWLILMLIVGYAIYASTSIYNANKKKEVSKSNNWLRCIVTGLVLIGIVAGYLLFAAQLAIWSGVVSIIVL